MNKKQVIAILLVTAAIVSPVFAKTIEVKPKDISDWENFTPRELKIIQKDVNEGHQPWRSDPVAYAKLFMKCRYPKLDVNKMETVPAKVMLKYNNATVKIIYNNKEHIIFLHKAFPSNPESIWVIEKMVTK